MSINFASSSLQARISCSTVSVDGSEVDNLITDDPRRRTAGFLAEAFVNPPVHITLSFPCAIDIHRLVVNGQLSSQRSVGFQVLTAVSNNRTAHYPLCDDRIFRPVGRCFSAKESSLCFTNFGYKQRDVFGADREQPYDVGRGDGIVHEKLHHPISDHLSRVWAVTLSVTRTANGSAVAIRRLEVWGQPAVGTPAEMVLRLKRDLIGRLSPPSSPPLEKTQTSALAETADHSCIPPEYLDAITCELMSLPILLPSGMAVDRSTLDRYASAEAQWGRKPSDPFTGRSFDEGHKPVVHSSLKARLDRFATMEGKLAASSSPKIIGSVGSYNSAGLVTSRLIVPHLNDEFRPTTSTVSSDTSSIASVELSRAVENCSRVMVAEGNASRSEPNELLADRHLMGPVGRHNCSAIQLVGRNCVAQRTARLASSSKGSRKRTRSADEARHSPAAKRSEVESVSDRNNSTYRLGMQALGCCKCCQMENIYRLPCAHHICRQCLMCDTRCAACGITFRTSDPVRVHY